MTRTTDTRTGIDYTPALAILPTLRQTDPDDDCLGFVGELADAALLAPTRNALTDAGYEVSDSRDDEGRVWLWVVATDADAARQRRVEFAGPVR